MIQITIGTTHGGSTLLGLNNRQAQFESAILESYGGFTKQDAKGGWKSPDGDTVLEPTLVYTVHGAPDPHREQDLAARACKLFSQDCVALYRARNDSFSLVDKRGNNL